MVVLTAIENADNTSHVVVSAFQIGMRGTIFYTTRMSLADDAAYCAVFASIKNS